MHRFGGPILIAICFEAVVAQVLAEEIADYLPLQEGNTWTYLHRAEFDYPGDGGFAVDGWIGRDIPLTDYLRADYVTVTMTHWEEIDGELYGFLWDIFSDGKLFRKSEEGDVFEHRGRGKEWLYDVHTPGIGENDEISYSFRDDNMLISMDVRRWRETIETPAGDFEGYRYGIQMHNDLNYIWTIHLVPDVGMVYWRLWSDGNEYDELSLVQATVNGRTYGTTTGYCPSTWGAIKAQF